PDIKHEDVKAKYNNGVLTVTLPKVEEIQDKKRKIDIE
ncbi:MAG TPA: Hsp20 family protein, partial [Clostridiaceae bacterium]|nr:Hsp20 family protein [Clostridiaceae bacterium]